MTLNEIIAIINLLIIFGLILIIFYLYGRIKYLKSEIKYTHDLITRLILFITYENLTSKWIAFYNAMNDKFDKIKSENDKEVIH